MDLAPRLLPVLEPTRPTAAVVVLHGGGSRRGNMVSPTQLSVLRMIPIARAVARAGGGQLAVFRLLNSARGWNVHHTPDSDVRWALDQLVDRYDEHLPIGLVGHSLGGRAALLSTGPERIHSVVALNPFLYPEDVAHDLRGTRTLLVQGTEDRISRPDRTATAALTWRAGGDVRLALVVGGRHAMLRRHQTYTTLAAGFTRHVLLGQPATGDIKQLLISETALEV